VCPPTSNSRSAITIIRSNWHLLPYEQLLALRNGHRTMAFALREDDFLFVKSATSPQCPPICYAPSDTAMEQWNEVAGWLREGWPVRRANRKKSIRAQSVGA
jgi:hypothetical protein